MKSVAIIAIALASCTIPSYDFDGDRFMCSEESPACPDGKECVDGFCEVVCEVPRTHAAVSDAVADLSCLKVSVGSGIHTGLISIDRDVVIEGEPGTVLDGAQLGTAVTIDSGTVVLRNLTITGGLSNRGGGIDSEGELVLEGVTISENKVEGGNTLGGGIYATSGSVTLTDCVIENNRAESLLEGDPFARGAAIYAEAPLSMTGTVISDNTTVTTGNVGQYVLAHGGAVYMRNTEATFGPGTVIVDNVASSTVAATDLNTPLCAGGGVYVRESTATFDGVIVSGNVARADHGDGEGAFAEAGGIMISNSTVTIQNGSSIEDNLVETVGVSGSKAEGGGVFASPGSTVTIEATSVDRNVADARGSAAAGQPTARGGGISTDDIVSLTLTDVSVSANEANSTVDGECRGGGLFAENRADGAPDLAFEISGSTIGGNVCRAGSARGGGLFLRVGDVRFDAIVRRSAVTRNVCEGIGDADEDHAGGGIAFRVSGAGTLDAFVENTTVSGNQIIGQGGADGVGISLSSVSEATLGKLSVLSSTITANTSALPGAGGGVAIVQSAGGDPQLFFDNSIIAGNTAAADADCFTGVFTAGGGGYNLINPTANCLLVTDDPNVVGDPLLGPLDDYGGATATHSLMADSPAIDGGNPSGCLDAGGAVIATDQRGELRPSGEACDIGAFEYQP